MGSLHQVGWGSQRYNAHPFSDGGSVKMPLGGGRLVDCWRECRLVDRIPFFTLDRFARIGAFVETFRFLSPDIFTAGLFTPRLITSGCIWSWTAIVTTRSTIIATRATVISSGTAITITATSPVATTAIITARTTIAIAPVTAAAPFIPTLGARATIATAARNGSVGAGAGQFLAAAQLVLGSFVHLGERSLAAEAYLALLIDVDDLDPHFVADAAHVLDFADAEVGQFGNVNHAILDRKSTRLNSSH